MTELATEPYKIGFRDHNAFVSAWIRRNASMRRSLPLLILIAALIIVVSFVPSWLQPNIQNPQLNNPTRMSVPMNVLTTVIPALAVSSIIVFLLRPLAIWLWQMITWAFNPIRTRSQSLRIVEDGLEKSVDGESHVYAWERFTDYSEDRRRALLFLGPNSAVILPKSAFATPAEGAAFTGALSARIHRKPHKDPVQNF